METIIKDLKISYSKKGYGQEIILLHGWGANKETFKNVVDHLSEDFCCYSIDLPGFGESEIKDSLDLEEYTIILREFILKHNLESSYILGHSFGGRIAINYASKYDCKKLILVDSAGIKRFKLKVFLKVKLYKLLKFLHIKTNMGSSDYKNANDILKQTMNKTIHVDLKDKLKQIKSETLIMWGEQDKTTPLKDGKLMNDLIRNSALIIVPKAKHFPYIEKYRFFMIMLKSFLLSDGS